MGVPKFFRWISERYPCLSELVREHEIPEFDNLYLDMNGIIHPCSHPEDDNVHFRMSEQQMFDNIKHYVEFIFRMIKPKKVFFMAVDGVAPRAKMNQQRSRRFRSAKDAELQEQKALKKGEKLPDQERFDSNCITPGTPFMVRLQSALEEFAERKVRDDPLWRGIRVYLSGHQTPGEGEHKIMEFIRHERSRSDYDPNTRHCLYGLDADLIMLGLTSHQAHFSLLREEVRFGGKKDKSSSRTKASQPETINFYLLHLSLLRDYIDIEFQSLRPDLPFGYDLERIIDDWVLLGFLVGNDFIPHLPDLHIHSEALPLLWNTYKKVLPTLDGYLQENGAIHLGRLQSFFATLAQFDDDTLKEKCSDSRWMKGKRGEKMAKELESLGQAEPDLQAFEFDSDASLSDEEEFLADEMTMMKQEYYQQKMGLVYDEAERRRQALEYVRALQWILYYYYRGVPSWGWYYPQHYAPYVSDVKNFADEKLDFDQGRPFLPFQQLMAVLPSASRCLLPDCLQPLMVAPESPILHFYPKDFQSDLNGKKQDWEAVVLIPFIEENQLLDAMDARMPQLTDEERSRNCFRPHLLFEWDTDDRRCRRTELPPDAFRSSSSSAFVAAAPRATFHPGFPVLRNLPFVAELRKAGVKVFQHNSRGYSAVLTLRDQSLDDEAVASAARPLLGKSVFANWPHLSEILLVSVSTGRWRLRLRGDGDIEERTPTDADRQQLEATWKLLREDSLNRFGVETSGQLPCLAYGRTLLGKVYEFGHDGTARIRSQWTEGEQPFLWQRVVSGLQYRQEELCTVDSVLPVGQLVFVTKGNWYGMSGEVLEHKQQKVRVQLQHRPQPDLSCVVSEDRFLSAQALAARCGTTGQLVSRITGTVFVSLAPEAAEAADAAADKFANRINAGLDLKFNRANLEVAGWTRKDASIGWLYSPKLAEALAEYRRNFPRLFAHIEASRDGNDHRARDIWPGDGERPPTKRLQEFLKQLPCAQAERVPIGSSLLSEPTILHIRDTIREQRQRVDELRPYQKARTFPPDCLFVCRPEMRHCLPDPAAVHRLLDRVVVCKPAAPAPIDSVGTVIGIRQNIREGDTELEILLDEEFEGGSTIRGCGSCCRVSSSCVLNISHGERAYPQNKYTVYLAGQVHGQLWAELKQQKQQKQQQQQQKQHHQHQHQQQQADSAGSYQRQSSFEFSALVNALQGQQQDPESRSDAMLRRLLAEWQWPEPQIRINNYGAVRTAVISFPNGFVLESQPQRRPADAKLDAVTQLVEYCESLKPPQQQQQPQQQASAGAGKPESKYPYQPEQPAAASSYYHHTRPDVAEQQLRAMLNIGGQQQQQQQRHQQQQHQQQQQAEAHLRAVLNIGGARQQQQQQHPLQQQHPQQHLQQQQVQQHVQQQQLQQQQMQQLQQQQLQQQQMQQQQMQLLSAAGNGGANGSQQQQHQQLLMAAGGGGANGSQQQQQQEQQQKKKKQTGQKTKKRLGINLAALGGQQQQQQ